MPSRLDLEKAKKNIENVLEKMRGSDIDVLTLNEYHRLFRKEVSFFRRSWAAAWLFMYYDQNENPKSGGKPAGGSFAGSSASGGMSAGGASAGGASAPAYANDDKSQNEIVLSEEESKKLFVSIGKNRRLFPREVISLIMSKTSAKREDIGSIRILDNYSFVQVRDTMADEIIKELNGIRFRGRDLTVNYAKPKSDSTAEAQPES